MNEFRLESDSLGEVRVPCNVHYGAQTQRAADNFKISGIRFSRRFIKMLGLVKAAAAEVNQELGIIRNDYADAISTAAREVAAGQWDHEFILDIFQTGSGTSTNMNANEVIASRANELMGGKKGDVKPIQPIEHVNRCQSSNDVIPTAIHLSVLEALAQELLPAVDQLASGLEAKAVEFSDVLKVGRTHLQDAVPMLLGQEFGGWAAQLRHGLERIQTARVQLLELPLGGTAIGTGLNAHPEFGLRICQLLAKTAVPEVRPADNLFESISARDAVVASSAALKTLAVSLIKIAGDVRLLSCGPRTGLAEISIPELQPGSSIMPGKVNPVMPEMMVQVCAQVIGNDAAVTLGGVMGQLDLNVMMPLMAHNLLQSIEILAAASRAFDEKCVSHGPEMPGNPDNVRGIAANRERCRQLVESSLMPVTALVPKLGYQRAAKIASESLRTGKTIREVVLEDHLISATELDSLLDLTSMAYPTAVHEVSATAIDRWRDDGGHQIV
ncbi:MAG: class II fumarate hydratase [Planctomycetaceae bacterium]|nr:class II fumarate hydratase [Planctomycetaceae bacterium]